MREEQDLDRNGQTSMQNNNHDQQNAGWLCIDGGDNWVSVFFLELALVAHEDSKSNWCNLQVSEEENGRHGQTDADECIVERCEIG